MEVPTNLGHRQTPGLFRDSINEFWWPIRVSQSQSVLASPSCSLLSSGKVSSHEAVSTQAGLCLCLPQEDRQASSLCRVPVIVLLLQGRSAPPLGLQREGEALPEGNQAVSKWRQKGCQAGKNTQLTFCGICHQFLLLYGPNVVLTEEARNRCALSRSLRAGTNLGLILSHK